MNPDRPAAARCLPGLAGSPGASHTLRGRPGAPAARALVLVLSLTLLAACSATVGDAGPLATPVPSTPPTASAAPANSPSGGVASAPASFAVSPGPASAAPAATHAVTIYLLQGEKLVPVHRAVPDTVAVATAATRALLAGPTAAEATGPGQLLTVIPHGTLLLGISIAGGVATVDLSREFESGGGSASMFARLAQVVYTLTQFPTVQGVLLHLDGQPVSTFSGEGIVIDRPLTRADYRGNLPQIFLDAPAWGAPIASPVTLTGSANVFEAQFSVEITTASGTVLANAPATASCGTGCWGSFSVTVPFSVDHAQPGYVTVYDSSPRDGSREHVRSYPVTLAPGA